jgi:alpha-amylase
MATDICFYFQVHQPWRLRHYRYLEVGKRHDYFDEEKNAQILRKVANKCYLPMNNLLYEELKAYGGRFKVSFSITGTLLEQCEKYAPEVIPSFKRLFETGHAELISETSHHSLAALYSPDEFKEQLARHRELCTRLLVSPSNVFRDTELITSNAIALLAQEMGFEAILAEGADHVLRWRSPLYPYRFKGADRIVGLLKNYRLSDDIAFRFSDRGWSQWPLTTEKYAEWIKMIELENPVSAEGRRPFIGLFMDYETFGEHQWESTGIFDFMRALPRRLLESGHVNFVTPTEAARGARAAYGDDLTKLPQIDAETPFSWADMERDLSAWRGNPIQDSSLRAIYRLEGAVKKSGSAELVETWRRLLTSDHFYYMCTKYWSDGDVHKYFSPYDSPYDAHIIFMNVVADLEKRLGEKGRREVA